MALDETALIKELYTLIPSSDAPNVGLDRARYAAAADAFGSFIRSSISSTELGGVACERHDPPGGDPSGVILYLHGGGYVLGSPTSHRHLAAEISCLTNCIVVVADYPLSPEHVFPAALNSVTGVLKAVCTAFPDLPLFMMGDSAGGGLAVAAALETADHACDVRAIVALSPWFDLTCSGPRYAVGAAHDGSLNPRRLKAFAAMYCGDSPATHPLISPRFAALESLPPMLIQVGRDEILCDDALAFAHRLEVSGRRVSIEVYDNVVHVWHWYWPLLEAGRRALGEIAAFLERAR